jgi:hypothetical protein
MDRERLRALVEAYRRGDRVTPVVAIDFDGDVRALSGSHRIAALLEVYDSDATVDGDLDGEVLVLDGDALRRAIDQAGDNTAARELHRLSEDRAGDYGALISALWEHLPSEAQTALKDQL